MDLKEVELDMVLEFVGLLVAETVIARTIIFSIAENEQIVNVLTPDIKNSMRKWAVAVKKSADCAMTIDPTVTNPFKEANG